MPSLHPGFEYDIFISYRQNDNRSGWVTEFVKALEEELAATIKEPVSIYFDVSPHDGLLETHNVDKSLEGKLKCLIFIPIISQTYCDPKSFAWQHEFCAFNKLASEDQFGRDIKLGNGNVTSRILPIKIHDLDAEDRSTIENEIGGVLRAIEFIYKESGVNRPLKSSDSRNENQNKTDYRNQINKTANAIKELTYSLRNGSTGKHSTLADGQTTIKKFPKMKVIGAISILIIIIIIWISWPPPDPGTSGKSIAVLAFDDLSPNHDQAYLGDGIAEELIFTLSKIPDLKVAGRHSAFSFKNKKFDPKEIGEELGVATVLTGSVRRSEKMIRVLVQLINVSDGFVLWSEQYDKEVTNVLIVQGDIAQAVISSLQLSTSGNLSSGAGKTIDPEAYEVYLKARQKLALRGSANLIEARTLFQNAIEMDPSFSPAYSGLGRVLSLLPYFTYSITSEEAVKEGNKVLKKALELDATNAEAYAVKGTLAGYYEWDWKGAGEAFEKAYAMAPQNAEIVNFLGDFYRQTEDKRSLETEQLAVTLDPLRAINHADLGSSYILFGDKEKAIKSFQKSFDMDPKAYDGTARNLVNLYMEVDNVDAARGVIAKLQSLHEDGSEDLLLKELKLRFSLKKGNVSDTTGVLGNFISLARQGKYEPVVVAELHFMVNNKGIAAEMLELAYQRRSFFLVIGPHDYFQSDTFFKTSFEKPELQELIRIRKKNGGI